MENFKLFGDDEFELKFEMDKFTNPSGDKVP